MSLIILALTLSALYCGAAYLYVYSLGLQGRINSVAAELNTFHLAQCFILSVGFLGLILRGS